MRCKRLATIILFFLLTVFSGFVFSAQISGTVKLGNGWQPLIYLASISTPENLTVASPDFIIAKTFIKPDGNFEFNDLLLPETPRFYRFYVVKNENSVVEFNTFNERNFVHFIVSNSSVFSFDADLTSNSFKILETRGDTRNEQLLKFENEYFEKKNQLNKDLSKAQKDFLTLNLEKYIREFVATCSNSLVGLYALYQLEEKETDFLRNNKFYFDFQKKINAEFPNTTYAEAYNNLLNDLVGFRKLVCEIPGVAPKWKDYLILIESVLLVLFLIVILVLFPNFKKNKKRNTSTNLIKSKYENLTHKEKEIFKLLASGKSNKEIAIELFIELSTVKTHINSIYKQTGVSNRKEAIQLYNSIKD